MNILKVTLASLCLLGCAEQKIKPFAAQQTTTTPHAFELAGTQVFSLDSAQTGNSYNIVVSLPNSYATAPANKRYPVLYVLDAQWQFPLIYTAMGAVNYDGDMPEVILVGISWKETNGNLMALRNQDLTPTKVQSNSNTGGAEKFQQFLRSDLFPYIENNFKGNEHRTVTGGSTSALFVFYTLLSQPDLFDGYIGSSPSLYWDNHVMDSILEKSSVTPTRPTRAYLAWGSLESGTEMSEFADKLKQKKIPNLEFTATPVIYAGHAAVNPECYTRGFQFVYQKNTIVLPKEKLTRFTGEYQTADKKEQLSFESNNAALSVRFDAENTLKLQATSNTEFYAQGNNLEYHFFVDKNNSVQSVTQIAHGDQTIFIKKK